MVKGVQFMEDNKRSNIKRRGIEIRLRDGEGLSLMKVLLTRASL